jgi:hypothetical protein
MMVRSTTTGKQKYAALLFIACIFAIFFGEFIRSFIGSLNGECPQGYALSDWLINYQGGFVRRGLAGELFRLISGQTYLYPTVNLVAFALGLTVTMTILLLLVYRSSNLSLKTAAIFTLNPAGLPLLYASVFYRKEMLFHVITIAHLLIIGCILEKRRYSYLYNPIAFILFAAMGTLAALTHETYIFMCFACNLILSLYFYHSCSNSPLNLKHYVKALTIQIMPLAFCIVAFSFKGNTNVAQTIWNSIDIADKRQMLNSVPEKLTYQVLTRVGTDMDHAINCIGFSTVHALKQQSYIITSGEIWLWALIVIISSYLAMEAGATFAVKALSNNRGGLLESDQRLAHEDVIREGSCYLFYLLLVSTLPLYLLGIDYGRWICCLIIMYTIVCLFQPKIVIFIWLECNRYKVMAKNLQMATRYQQVFNNYLSFGLGNQLLKNIICIYWLGFVSVSVCYQKIGGMYGGFVPDTVQNSIAIRILVFRISRLALRVSHLIS